MKMIDLKQLERERMLAAEQAVIKSIPKELLDHMEKSNARFAAEGGCKGCGSMRIGVHYGICSKAKDDLY